MFDQMEIFFHSSRPPPTLVVFERVWLQCPRAVTHPRNRTRHPSGGRLPARDQSSGRFRTHHLSQGSSLGRTQTHLPSGGPVTWPITRAGAIKPSGPIIHIQAISTSGTQVPGCSQTRYLSGVHSGNQYPSADRSWTCHLSRGRYGDREPSPKPPSPALGPAMYPGFVLQSSWNSSPDGDRCHSWTCLPRIRSMSRVESSSHYHAHIATGCIAESSTHSSARGMYSHRPREFGMTAAHAEGGHQSSTPCAWPSHHGRSLHTAFSQCHSRSRLPRVDSRHDPRMTVSIS